MNSVPAINRTNYSNVSSIIIKNLAENTTQEIVFTELKNLGIVSKNIKVNKIPKGKISQAFVSFETQEQRDQAFKKLQFQTIFEKVVSCSLYSNTKQNYKKNRIFIRGIKSDADPKKIFELLTQLGTISDISLFFNKDCSQLIGKGYFQLQKDEDYQKLIEQLNKNEKPIPVQDDEKYNFELVPYEKQQDLKQDCRIIIQDIKHTEEADQSNLSEVATRLSKQLSEKFQAKGFEVENVIYHIARSVDSAIVTFKTSEQAIQFIKGYDNKDTEIVNLLKDVAQTDKVPQVKVKFDKYKDYAALYLNYIVPKQVPEGENKEEYIKNVLTKYLEQTVETPDVITGVRVQMGKKPESNDNQDKFPDSFFANIFLKRGEFGVKFIQNYTKRSNKSEDQLALFRQFQSLFFNNNPNCTILINAAERRQMKKNKLQFTKEQVLNKQQLQPQMMQPLLRGPPMPMQYNNKPKAYQAPRPQPIAQPVREAPKNLFLTQEDITNNFDAFSKQEQKEQYLQLGQIIYPKVYEILKQKNKDDDKLTQIITGMIVDMDNFELGEILESLEDQEVFIERVDEAIELLESQDKQE